MHPEVDAAIEDIVNEVISGEDDIVELNLDEVETTDSIKKQIKEEFDGLLGMLDFKNYAHDIFRRYYVDGRVYHHLVVDPKSPQSGIQEVRPIDATKIRKVKEVKKEKDPATGGTPLSRVCSTMFNNVVVFPVPGGPNILNIRTGPGSVVQSFQALDRL